MGDVPAGGALQEDVLLLKAVAKKESVPAPAPVSGAVMASNEIGGGVQALVLGKQQKAIRIRKVGVAPHPPPSPPSPSGNILGGRQQQENPVGLVVAGGLFASTAHNSTVGGGGRDPGGARQKIVKLALVQTKLSQTSFSPPTTPTLSLSSAATTTTTTTGPATANAVAELINKKTIVSDTVGDENKIPAGSSSSSSSSLSLSLPSPLPAPPTLATGGGGGGPVSNAAADVSLATEQKQKTVVVAGGAAAAAAASVVLSQDDDKKDKEIQASASSTLSSSSSRDTRIRSTFANHPKLDSLARKPRSIKPPRPKPSQVMAPAVSLTSPRRQSLRLQILATVPTTATTAGGAATPSSLSFKKKTGRLGGGGGGAGAKDKKSQDDSKPMSPRGSLEEKTSNSRLRRTKPVSALPPPPPPPPPSKKSSQESPRKSSQEINAGEEEEKDEEEGEDDDDEEDDNEEEEEEEEEEEDDEDEETKLKTVAENTAIRKAEPLVKHLTKGKFCDYRLVAPVPAAQAAPAPRLVVKPKKEDKGQEEELDKCRGNLTLRILWANLVVEMKRLTQMAQERRNQQIRILGHEGAEKKGITVVGKEPDIVLRGVPPWSHKFLTALFRTYVGSHVYWCVRMQGDRYVYDTFVSEYDVASLVGDKRRPPVPPSSSSSSSSKSTILSHHPVMAYAPVAHHAVHWAAHDADKKSGIETSLPTTPSPPLPSTIV